MSFLSKTSAGAASILVALLLCYAGCAATPAVAQYDAPPESQYDLPPEEQYAPSPAGTVPLPEEQYGPPSTGTAPLPEDQNGGGDTDGDNGGTASDAVPPDDGAATEATVPEGPSPRKDAGGVFPSYLDGVLIDGLKLLAALSVVTTLLFLVERSQDRRGR